MVTVETVSIVFTALSISLAAFYYINTLRNTQRNQQLAMETRKAQHYMQMRARAPTSSLGAPLSSSASSSGTTTTSTR